MHKDLKKFEEAGVTVVIKDFGKIALAECDTTMYG